MTTADDRRPQAPVPSWGNMSEAHWSRARRGSNREALEYYRLRSRAPGVEAGGEERNFYCMECDGVIPFDPPPGQCPHCGVTLDENVRRYFNWVEIDGPPASDFRALLPLLIGATVVLAAVVGTLIAWLS